MKTLFFVTVFLISGPVFAKLPKSDWAVSKGKLTYHVKYVLKTVEGVSEGVKGKGQCVGGICRFLVAAPVKSFLSGDGNRDNHMLEVTKAATNPVVAVKVEFPESAVPGELSAKAEVQFAGQTHTYPAVKMLAQVSGTSAHVRGQLPLKLSDFAVNRPSLLGVAIDDSTPVDFDLDWN